ncbi:MAG: hypothetical protein LKG79_00615 [Furfurilactobacillus sp.]|jgi:transcriptional regulator of arginine metabolism|uniref:Arginine repressor n=2 Tax=Furfurilactobacillus TaxID=2767882 RepID=A0A0R1RGF1_9LACO|nr:MULTISPECIES: hypothetical protein [Furfurilactobacillus]KRL56096.1 hypothetical protein FD35_GL002135 [Furfurilactobacillus rossiae DSM 15814]MCF6159777.1 hypothetical protein [Furfurilactobacillus milii]MCF6163138.1 hypothetical protein [Furfurilactobacillus milii]MCF6166601.1 hypothetical protein [Furfurilactobacillus rossiae]MCF6419158.1 hypothetical protein [Furfurilactobacillus milii]
MKREDRQTEILKIIRSQKISSITELRGVLAEREINVAMATLSRDLQSLRVGKIMDSETKVRYFAQQSIEKDPSDELLVEVRDEVTDVIVNDFIVVIRTVPYWTDSISDLIDRSDFPEVVSTLAGYDNMWVLTKGNQDATRFANRIRALMG